uniref:Uncharacterized protein n=1 Tax=Trypanosoma congolense (strain IL3000) TaxID=1068625 RepID=G0UQE6_TRYCI|nr:conserved hypothetical protein [Trypanosoma congolense IL3000]
MSQVTADLEYFKCDMCGIYLHKDIFCDHRRECKGLHSDELKKSECRKVEEALNEGDKATSQFADPGANPPIPVEVVELHQQARIRREVANKYQRAVDKRIEEQLSSEKMRALAAFLNE